MHFSSTLWTSLTLRPTFFRPSPTYLTDVDIVQRVDSLARLLDILGDRIGQQLVDDLLQIRAGHITGDDGGHLPADFLDLGVLGVASLALRHRILDGEADAEHTQQVAVGGLNIDRALDQGLPFLDHGPGKEQRNSINNFPSVLFTRGVPRLRG